MGIPGEESGELYEVKASETGLVKNSGCCSVKMNSSKSKQKSKVLVP
jgi:hypothetical protein